MQESAHTESGAKRLDPTLPESRIDCTPENIEQGLAKLVLSLIELLRQLLERQAIRRMEGGSLTEEQPHHDPVRVAPPPAALVQVGSPGRVTYNQGRARRLRRVVRAVSGLRPRPPRAQIVPPTTSDPRPTSAPPELLPVNARLPIRPDGAAVVRGRTT